MITRVTKATSRHIRQASLKKGKQTISYVRVTDHEHRLGFQIFEPEMKALFVQSERMKCIYMDTAIKPR